MGINAALRGWANHFHYWNSNGPLEKMKVHAEDRLRTHLTKQHKVKDRGIGLGRFPSQQISTKYEISLFGLNQNLPIFLMRLDKIYSLPMRAVEFRRA